jgi:6-phosphogluconolactonase (cycloisomerase 2 family)
MNPTSALSSAEFQPAARNPVGRIHVRHAGH